MAGDLNGSFQALILCDVLILNLIISLKQEAGKDDKAHIVENGTHAEETNAEGNVDDSIVMPSILSFFPSCFLLTLS